MDKKDATTKTKAWFIVLLALLDDIIVLAIIALILWIFDVELSIPVIIVLVLALGTLIFILHRALIPAIMRRKTSGAEGMLGMTGEVTESLCPKGTVKINGEYWKAVCNEGDVNTGEEVEVLRIIGLNLEVRKKSNECS
ncbi:MAG: NfeD family protein [Dehalococcoidales bacterium]|nr:NfeD family protein [Dehalococcoidales bacterium]